MRRLDTLVLLATLMAGAGAIAADPTQSADCHRALDALQKREATADTLEPRDRDSAARRHLLDQLSRLRRAAARACLGATGDEPPPSAPVLQTPIVVPLVAVPPAAPPPPPVTSATSPPSSLPSSQSLPKRLEVPPVLRACDNAACMSSDGSRLQIIGPGLLLGPRGVCVMQGLVMVCPP